LKRYILDLPQQDLHDIELKYARIDCQKGSMDFAQYQTFTEQDRLLFTMWVDLHAASGFFEGKSLRMVCQPIVEQQLRTTIQRAEEQLENIEPTERLTIRVAIINLYGRGIFIFGWDAIEQIKRHFAEVQKSRELEVIKSMENFIYECEHPFDDVVVIYQKRFEEHRTLNNWYEWLNLYIRHFRLDEADDLYKKLFLENRDLIGEESEFIYRAYIDYVTVHNRDMKDALKCYLDAKPQIKDADIANYWEMELMLYTSTFNDPERFEEERFPYVQRGG
jgi:hypothetical protein